MYVLFAFGADFNYFLDISTYYDDGDFGLTHVKSSTYRGVLEKSYPLFAVALEFEWVWLT